MYVLKHLILAALRIVTGNGKSPAYIGIWLEILNTLYSVCHAAAAMSGENIDCFPGQINVFQERAGWLANCISPDGQNKPYCIIPEQIFRISSDLRLNVVFLLAYDHSDGVFASLCDFFFQVFSKCVQFLPLFFGFVLVAIGGKDAGILHSPVFHNRLIIPIGSIHQGSSSQT